MPSFGSVARLLREWWLFAGQQSAQAQHGPPILVTGAQRCGTSWFSEMLHVPGTRLYHEPIGQCCSILWSQDVRATDERPYDDTRLRTIVERVVSGKEWRTYCYRHHRAHVRRATKYSPARLLPVSRGRVIVKDPTAVGMIEPVQKGLRCDVVLLLRHPCGYASSLRKLGWDPRRRVRLLIEHPYYQARGTAAYGDLYRRYDKLTELQQYTFQLGLLNAIALSRARRGCPIRTYRFEWLAADPLPRFRQVFDDLTMTYGGRARRWHRFLTSGPAADSFQRHDVRRCSAAFASIWRERLSQAEIHEVRSVWQEFSFGHYADDDEW